MAKSTRAYGIGSPLQEVFPKPIVAQRAPTTADVGYEIGQSWVDNSADASYVLTSVAGGSATWSSTANPAVNQAGLQSFDGSGTLNGRTLTAGSQSIDVTNGDGVSGNPTVDRASVDRQTSGQFVNLGMSYDAINGTFKICAADGTNLSASNPAYVTLPSTVTPGTSIVHTVTSNYNFRDATVSSEIIGNTFGTPPGAAANFDIPFFIYFATDSSDANPICFISRVPGLQTMPSATSYIGAPDDAVSDRQFGTWSFDNITETNYVNVPCVYLGCMRMRKDASDDWTVQPINEAVDGIGVFPHNKFFQIPAGAFGAASSSYMRDNGGTAAQFSNNSLYYSVSPSGLCSVLFTSALDAGTDGAGAVTAEFILPMAPQTLGTSSFGIGSYYITTSVGGNETASLRASSKADGTGFFIIRSTALGVYQNTDFGNGSRTVIWSGSYPIDTDSDAY